MTRRRGRGTARRATLLSRPQVSGELLLDLLEYFYRALGSGRTRCSQEAEKASRGARSSRPGTCFPCAARSVHLRELSRRHRRTSPPPIGSSCCRRITLSLRRPAQLQLPPRHTPHPDATAGFTYRRRGTCSQGFLVQKRPHKQGFLVHSVQTGIPGTRKLLGETGGAPGKRHSRLS